jgi:hypothetical protein
MRPLVVRRAGDFEKTTFDLSVVVGAIGLVPGTDISSSVQAVLPGATWWFWSLIIAAGLGGRITTWKTDRDRTVRDIRHECQSIYSFGSLQLLLDGRSATIPALFGFAIVVASARRLFRIWRDLRKLKRAEQHPHSSQSPTLADPDDNEEEGERSD